MCLCKLQMGYCSAAYYSTETRSLPEKCTRCRFPYTDLECLKTWSQCVKKQDIGAHGRVSPVVNFNHAASIHSEMPTVIIGHLRLSRYGHAN